METTIFEHRSALNTGIRLRLTAWRQSQGSRAVVCQRVHASESTLRNWERGARPVDVTTLMAWQRANYITRDELMRILFAGE